MERRSDYEEEIDFVKRQLIPEMLHDRCFCEAGSREFVELDSVVVEALTDEATAQEPTERSDRALRQIYAAEAVVKFSGEAQVFHLFVKLLPVSLVECERAYAAFQNEEMFYSKMTKFYDCGGLAKCYTASLGRYELPVVVLENLRASGYRAIHEDLREDHLELCVKFLGRFHGRGFALKSRNFQLFREFYAKMLDTTFYEDPTMKTPSDVLSRLLGMSTSLTPDLREKIARKFVPSLVETARSFATTVGDLSTICHGHFSRRNVLFRSQGDEPIDVKVIDWASMKYCSPAVDFARILLENLSLMNARTKMQRLLEIYFAATYEGHVLCEVRVVTRETKMWSVRVTACLLGIVALATIHNGVRCQSMLHGSSGKNSESSQNSIEDASRSGPYFDKSASKNVTALLGKTTYLNCRVKNLGNKTMTLQVSWVRHRDIHLLTIGRYTYTNDQRFRAIHNAHSDDWTLQIKYPQHRDSGIYECQVSTTPHMSHFVHLNVIEPKTEILGAPDLYIDRGSTINLTCVVLQSPEPPAYIFWNHNDAIISYDSTRGGVSVVTEKGDSTTSFLLVQEAKPSDSGRYTCNPSNAQPKSITVHVLNGEYPAAMQHGGQAKQPRLYSLLLCLCLLLY